MARDAGALRAALLELGFTTDGVLAVLGPDAFAALGRGEAAPVRHVLAERDDDALTDLIRLFLLGEVVPAGRLARAVPLDEAEMLGLIADVAEGDADQIRARVHVQPYPTPAGDGFVVSDPPAWMRPTGGKGLRPDHVVGIGGATITLATITPRDPVDQTLDLGTGCGIQALLAAGHSARVVATDRSERALAMAQLTAALSGVSLDCRAGSLFEPAAEDDFDLIVANPPFVISPHARYTYREAPLRADDLSRTVVQQAAAHLRPGGVAVLLANWLHKSGESWHDRLASWAAPDLQMWVAQRERLTPSEYVDVWLRDSSEHGGPDHDRRYAEWLTYFDDLGATGIGFGWIVLRRDDVAWFVAEDVSDADRLPTGAEVLAQLSDYTALHDATAVRLLDSMPRWRADAELHGSWSPARPEVVDVQATKSWRPAENVDPVLVEVLADSGTLRERIDRQAAGDPDLADELTARTLVGVRRLVGAGLVTLEAVSAASPEEG